MSSTPVSVPLSGVVTVRERYRKKRNRGNIRKRRKRRKKRKKRERREKREKRSRKRKGKRIFISAGVSRGNWTHGQGWQTCNSRRGATRV